MNEEHTTNICVVGIVHRDGKILIAKRAATKKNFPDRFETPGGHVEPGEALEQALIRELDEELHITVEVGLPVHAFMYVSDDREKVEICYMCTLTPDSGEPKINPEDHSEYRWITEAEINLLPDDDEEIIAVRRVFKAISGGAQ